MTVLKTRFPALGMGDSSGFADRDTGWRDRAKAGFAGSAMVADLFAFLVFYRSHWFFTKNVYFVRPHLEYFYRTGLHTLATAVAFVSVKNEKPISRGVAKTVMSNHHLSNQQ